jgi:hypothetical protein
MILFKQLFDSELKNADQAARKQSLCPLLNEE